LLLTRGELSQYNRSRSNEGGILSHLGEEYRLGEIRGIYAPEDRSFGLRVNDLNDRNNEFVQAYLKGYERGRTLRHVN
jgi:hypothetical protein